MPDNIETATIGANTKAPLKIPRLVTGLWQLADGHSDSGVDVAKAADGMDVYVKAGLTAFDMADRESCVRAVGGGVRDGLWVLGWLAWGKARGASLGWRLARSCAATRRQAKCSHTTRQSEPREGPSQREPARSAVRRGQGPELDIRLSP